MATYVTMPRLSLTMTEGIVVNWLKKEGDTVVKGEPILEVETEKVSTAVEAPASGILARIVAPAGTTVPVAEPVAIIAEPGEEIPSVEKEISRVEVSPLAIPKAEKVERPLEVSVPEVRVKISPLARKLAEERGVDITRIRGTGPAGRIVKEDVLKAAEMATRRVEEGVEVAEVLPMTATRRTIAERLSQSYRSAVHTTVITEVDMTEAMSLRKKLLPEIKEKTGASLTYTGIIVKAVARALKEHPVVNSALESDKIKIIKDVNMGVAIDVEEGLIVPVIHHADKKSLAEIVSRLSELSEKARKKQLSLDDVERGTFTVTNLGTFGVHTFVPIINPPQAAILGVGSIDEKPVAIDGKVEIRPRMNLSLVFDHRVIDGAEAGRFLQTLKKILENPSTLSD